MHQTHATRPSFVFTCAGIALAAFVSATVHARSDPQFVPKDRAAVAAAEMLSDADCAAQSANAAVRVDVVNVYNSLVASKTVRERKFIYKQLSSAMKAAIWKEHLESEVSAHPEFTDLQLRVISDAEALFVPEFFSIPRSDPKWSMFVDEPLQALATRAKAAFPPDLARDIFADLGPHLKTAEEPAEPAHRRGLGRIAPLSACNGAIADCNCSTVSDWCGFNAGPGFTCQGGGCYWVDYCGTGWQYGCTGLCTYVG